MTLDTIRTKIAEYALVAVLATAFLVLQSCTDDHPPTVGGAPCRATEPGLAAPCPARLHHA